MKFKNKSIVMMRKPCNCEFWVSCRKGLKVINYHDKLYEIEPVTRYKLYNYGCFKEGKNLTQWRLK